jgi:hypothetical protein
MNAICPYGYMSDYCPNAFRYGEEYHLYDCPLRKKDKL